jgi:predicted nucleic acid-binding protein
VKGYLLDTNVVSEPTRPRPDANVLRWLATVDPDIVYLSAFTQAELRKGIVKIGPGRRADRLEVQLENLRRRFAGRILPVDDGVLDRWGRLVGAAEVAGAPLSGIDALFAATALEHDLTLVTRNVRHMRATGVILLDPWAASQL